MSNMFSFASKMLNTIMGTEEGGPGVPGGGPGGGMGGLMPGQQMGGQQQQQHHPQQQQHQQQQQGAQQGMRPGMGGFPQARPNFPQGGPMSGGPRGGPPTFSGPRPSPGVQPRGVPPNFGGGPPRPMSGGPGTPHRFNGPQPPMQMQSPGPQRGMLPSGPGAGQQQPMQPMQAGQQGPGMMRPPGMGPGPGMRPRGPGPGGFPPQQRMVAPNMPGGGPTGGMVGVGGPAASTATGPVPSVDLSHLSAEERAMIENVMAKAQQLEQDAPPAPGPLPHGPHAPMSNQLGGPRMMRPDAYGVEQQGNDYGGRPCPLCRQRDVSGRDGHPGQECSECHTLVCNRCGGMATHPETKRPEWTCGNCIKRRRMGGGPNAMNSGMGGNQNLGPRPPLGSYNQQQSPNDWDRRDNTGAVISGAGMMAGQGGGGQQQQQQQQQRWENEREFANADDVSTTTSSNVSTISSTTAKASVTTTTTAGRSGGGGGATALEEVGKWESSGSSQGRNFSSEMTTSSPYGTEQSEDEIILNPPSSKIPPEVALAKTPFTSLLSPQHNSRSMSTPLNSNNSVVVIASEGNEPSTSYSHSTSNPYSSPSSNLYYNNSISYSSSSPPEPSSSFVKLHGRSQSMDVAEGGGKRAFYSGNVGGQGGKSGGRGWTRNSFDEHENYEEFEESEQGGGYEEFSERLESGGFGDVRTASRRSFQDASSSLSSARTDSQFMISNDNNNLGKKPTPSLVTPGNSFVATTSFIAPCSSSSSSSSYTTFSSPSATFTSSSSSCLATSSSSSTSSSMLQTTSLPSTTAVDPKTSALMEELSKLQSAVESYTVKRRERAKETEGGEKPGGSLRDSYSLRQVSISSSSTPISPPPRSPSPSPSPKGSPEKSGESFSPLLSLSPNSLYHHHASSLLDRGGSPDSPPSQFPEPRKAIVLREHDLDDYKSSSEEEGDSDSDEEGKTVIAGGGSEVITYYDHSPGDVYTIPEEEDEGGSPTGGDLVTSLNRPGIQGMLGESGSPHRRLLGQEGSPLSNLGDGRAGGRPLRAQRSLDNRLTGMNPGQQSSMGMDGGMQQSVDSHGNSSYLSSNLNTQSQPSQSVGPYDNQTLLNQNLVNSSMPGGTSTAMSQSTGILASSTSSTGMSGTGQNIYGQSPQLGGGSGTQAVDMTSTNMGSIQRPIPIHQQPQPGQVSMGVSGMDWNNTNTNTQSMMGPTGDNLSMSSADPMIQSNNSQNQSYQTQQQNNTISLNQQVPSTSGMQQQNQQLLSTASQPVLQPQQQQQLQNQIQQQQQLQNQIQQQQHQLQQFPNQSQINQPLLQNLGAPTTQMPQSTSQGQFSSLTGQVSMPSSSDGLLSSQQQNLQTQPQQWPMNQSQQTQQQQNQQSGMDYFDVRNNMGGTSPGMYNNQMQQLAGGGQNYAGGPNQSGNMASNNQMYSQQDKHSGQMGHSQQQQQNLAHMQQQQLQQQQHGTQAQMTHQQYQGMGHLQQGSHQTGNQLLVNTSQAGPGAKSISGLLADFSRALGLGNASPRPSPIDDKSEPFPIPSSGHPGHSGAGNSGMSGQGMAHSGYDHYSHQSPHHQQHSQAVGMQQNQLNYQGVQQAQSQQIPLSAFAPIQDSNQAYLQRHQQQSMTLPQSHQQQQYNLPGSMHQSLSASQPMINQSSLLSQQQAANLGVGVVGALSPAQAHMYQQQMALQHQAQHMKKTSRRAHTGSTSAQDMNRRDGTSTLLIGGQGMGGGGMTIGSLTPAVVTSLGTFIGGSPALIGTSILSQNLAGTPRGSRDQGGDSSDTMSETDSQKSLRMRRKLPCLPPDQEAAPLPSTKKRDRQRAQEFRSLSPMRMSSMENAMHGRAYGLSSLSLSRPSASESNLRKLCMGQESRPEAIPRPGSALGLLQGSHVVSSMGIKADTVYPMSGNMFSTAATYPGLGLRSTTTGFGPTTDMTNTTSVLSGLYPSYRTATTDNWSSNMAELAACLPPDLQHLLNKGDPGVGNLGGSAGLSGLSGLTSSLGDTSLNVGSHLPSYMRTLREQLQEESRQLLSEERRRLEALRERDRELGARLDAVTRRAGSETLRSRADISRSMVGISRSAGASPLLSRKMKGHRRQLSDPKLSLPFSPIQEDGDSELQDFDRNSAGLLRPPYKSYEYESLEDAALLRPTPNISAVDWDHSQSYLASSSWAAAGGVLRETAISSMGSLIADDEEFRSRLHSRLPARRSSDGEAWTAPFITRSVSSTVTRDKRHPMRRYRKSRSWHPSPYVSEEEDDDEEDTMSREEKKARIKAEIARRRQQIQEKSGLHHELVRISRLRDLGDTERHSVLKSVDQLLRDQYTRYDNASNAPPSSSGGGINQPHFPARTASMYASSHQIHHQLRAASVGGVIRDVQTGIILSPSASEEDRSIERIASTFRSDDYGSAMDRMDRLERMERIERYGEMSPMATDSESMGSELGNTPAAMPLLPDMPTRSRRLLEECTHRGYGSGGTGVVGSSYMSGGEGRSSVGGQGGGGADMKGWLPTKGHVKNEKGKRFGGESEAYPPALPDDYEIRERDCGGNLSAQSGGKAGNYKKEAMTESIKVSGPETTTDRKRVKPGKIKQGRECEGIKSKYKFGVNRFLLHRDPKDKSVGGMGFGMKIVGGKEIPDSNGRIGAYVAKIYRGGLIQSIGEIHEGDVVLEWNGISLDNKTFEEVQSVLDCSEDEIEIVMRSNFDIHTGKSRPKVNKNERVSSEVATNYSSRSPFTSGGDNCQSGKDYGSTISGRRERRRSSASKDRIRDDTSVSSQGYGDGVNGGGEKFGMPKSPSSSTEATTTSVTTSSLHRGLDLDERQRQQVDLSDSQYPSTGSSVRRDSVLSPPSVLPEIDSSSLVAIQEDPSSALTSATNHRQHRQGSQLVETRMGRRRSSKCSRSSASSKQVEKSHPSYGQVVLQICHDSKAHILYVTLLRVKLGLGKQGNDKGRELGRMDPYVVVYLLPERIIENQRRTKHVAMNSDSKPQWNQTMVYPNVSFQDLQTKTLEVAAWNFNPPPGQDEFIGSVDLELSEDGILDEQPHTFVLRRPKTLQGPGNWNPAIRQKRSSDASSARASMSSSGPGGPHSLVPKGISALTGAPIPVQYSISTDCHASFCCIL